MPDFETLLSDDVTPTCYYNIEAHIASSKRMSNGRANTGNAISYDLSDF